MSDAHDLVLYHDNASIAAAVGALLSGSLSIDAVASQYGVTPDAVANTIISLGIDDEIEATLPKTEANDLQQERPSFLDQRPPVTIPKRGIRDDSTRAIVSDFDEVPFIRALLSEASQRAQDEVSKGLTNEFGSGADQLRVTVCAVPTSREYPDHVRWIAVKYPIDKSGPTSPTKVNSPPFEFERLEEALPKTVTVTVDLNGETFTVHNIPVVASEEYWQ